MRAVLPPFRAFDRVFPLSSGVAWNVAMKFVTGTAKCWEVSSIAFFWQMCTHEVIQKFNFREKLEERRFRNFGKIFLCANYYSLTSYSSKFLSCNFISYLFIIQLKKYGQIFLASSIVHFSCACSNSIFNQNQIFFYWINMTPFSQNLFFSLSYPCHRRGFSPLKAKRHGNG